MKYRQKSAQRPTDGCVAVAIWLTSRILYRHCLNTVAAEKTIMAVAEQISGYSMQAVIPLEKLRDFIAFARARCQPELTDEAGQDLVNAYQTMRHQGIGRNCITATPRQLESMIRLSEALARMRLSPIVERHDVAEAVRLMKVGPV